jgi:hypothetical protein
MTARKRVRSGRTVPFKKMTGMGEEIAPVLAPAMVRLRGM